jgi:hypothetical protein
MPVYKVMIDYLALADEGHYGEKGPAFTFENITEAVLFIEMCFKNGYDVYIKHEEAFEKI